jgi:PAS domain S-box-containing protein
MALEKKILVVDDDEATLAGIALFLEARGFEVFRAENGRIGLECFRREVVDLVLLDLIMPEMGGFEVLAALKEEAPDTPVIVISGTDRISDAVEALHLGAWDYVLKPIQDMQVLLHAVRTVLERRRLILENQRYQDKLESDIQERTRELMEANKSYRAIFNSVAAAMFVVDEAGTVVETNKHASAQFGIASQSIIGRPLGELIVEDDRSSLAELLERLESDGGCQCELRGLGDGVASTVNDVVGTDVYFQGQRRRLLVFMDITERKRMAEQERLHHQQLLQADKMASLGVLVSGVAHEITNPNNLIKMNAPLLKKIWGAVEPVLREYCRERGDYYVAPWIKCSEIQEKVPAILNSIMDGAGRIDSFVKELKNFAVPAPPDYRPDVGLNDVVGSAVMLLSNLLGKSTNRFSVQYGENLPLVRGNPQHLEQVAINLLENSCHALQSKEKELVVITRAANNGRLVQLVVRDEGIGMEQEILDKITDAFFSTKRESGGTGLGLSISSRIVAEHGGSLEFQSSPGEGATAIVSLPAHLT